MARVGELSQRDNNKLLIRLIAIELGMVLIYVANSLAARPIWVIHDLFNLDGEATVVSWFSSVQLFAVGLAMAFHGRRVEAGERPARWFYFFCAAGFAFLSADEAVAIHEKVTVVLSRFAWLPRFRNNHGICFFIYFPVGLIALAMTARQFLALWQRHPRAFWTMTIGMVIFLFGAIGIEIFEYQFVRELGMPRLYVFAVACEEFCEMIGASMMLHGALQLWIAESTALQERTAV